MNDENLLDPDVPGGQGCTESRLRAGALQRAGMNDE